MIVTITLGTIAQYGANPNFKIIYVIGNSNTIIKHITIWKTFIFPVACIAVVRGVTIEFIKATTSEKNKNCDV